MTIAFRISCCQEVQSLSLQDTFFVDGWNGGHVGGGGTLTRLVPDCSRERSPLHRCDTATHTAGTTGSEVEPALSATTSAQELPSLSQLRLGPRRRADPESPSRHSSLLPVHPQPGPLPCPFHSSDANLIPHGTSPSVSPPPWFPNIAPSSPHPSCAPTCPSFSRPSPSLTGPA